jgi:hypothetical protein
MRNPDLRGIAVLALMCLAALGLFLFGVLAKTVPTPGVRPPPTSPATQGGGRGGKASLRIAIRSLNTPMGHSAANLGFRESKKEKHHA